MISIIMLVSQYLAVHTSTKQTHRLVVDQIDGVQLLLGAVAERVDQVPLVGAHAFRRPTHDVDIPLCDETLRAKKACIKPSQYVATGSISYYKYDMTS